MSSSRYSFWGLNVASCVLSLDLLHGMSRVIGEWGHPNDRPKIPKQLANPIWTMVVSWGHHLTGRKIANLRSFAKEYVPIYHQGVQYHSPTQGYPGLSS